jgi:hypothetical protein
MSLREKTWTRVSMHEVVLAWLRAERGKGNLAALLQARPDLLTLLDHGNLNDPDENRKRLRLLYLNRNLFVIEIPPDTNWYEVESLTDVDLAELHAVNHPDWTASSDQNELLSVARRKRLVLRDPPSDWNTPILWGHDKTGPFTILEGNNRLAAYAASGRSGLDIHVFVGLSPMRCIFHIHDECGPLIQDMILGQLVYI